MKRVGVVGWPIEHSLSPVMHNAAFQALGMDDWVYDAMAVPPDIPRHAVIEPKRHGYIGLNVTVPFKQAVMTYVHPDDKARAIGAVNTIIYGDDIGTNTDVDGIIDDLLAHDVALEGERVIVLGAGGAARAAVYGLWQQGADVVVVNRTLSRAQDMLMQLTMSGGVQNVQAVTLDEAVEREPSLIVNCTSAGLWPDVDTSPWVDGIALPRGITVYDMVYRPAKTRLMQQVEQAGGRAIGGLGMLVRQGAASFRLWTGVEPPVDVMYKAAEDALAARQIK